MPEIGTVDVNSPSRGGSKGPSMTVIVLGIGALVGVGVLLSRRGTNAGGGQIAPMSSANIAFSSLENSLLNFQGLYEANTAQFNAQQSQMRDAIQGLGNEQQQEWSQIRPGLVDIQNLVGPNSQTGNWLKQIYDAILFYNAHGIGVRNPPGPDENLAINDPTKKRYLQ